MAKKTGKKPYKFRQARKDAKAATKGVFEGKKPAGTRGVAKDITTKMTLEDREAVKELEDARRRQRAGKADFITTDKGERVSVKPTETAQERMARDRAAAREAAYRKYPLEEGEKPAKKVESTKKFKKKAVAKKAPVKKAAAKPAAAPTAATETPAKKMTRAEKSAANKAKWASMTPEERKNWSAKKAAEPAKKAAVKPAPKVAKTSPTSAGTKRPTLASLKKNEAAELKKAAERVAAKKAAAKPRTVIKKSDLGKKPATAGTKLTPEGAKVKAKAPGMSDAAANEIGAKAKTKKPVAKGKFPKLKGAAKGGAALALAGEVVSLAKGSTAKDAAEINRLRNKLADVTGKKRPGGLSRFKEGAASEVGQLASLATMGIIGKTRRQRMDELNKKIAKASKTKQLRYGPKGESLVPGTAAYKAGSKTRPSYTKASSTNTGAGGATTKISGSYTVKKGDTLSGIAQQAGVSLSELRAANPAIMKKKKYKQGSMIWSGTKVRIPKK